MTDPAETISLDLGRFRHLLLDTAHVGMALVQPPDFEIVLFNSTFATWFPDVKDGQVRLSEIISEAEPEEISAVLTEKGKWSTELEVKPKHRKIALVIEATLAEGSNVGTVIVQSQNVSKIKELEYMIESYSKMIERQNRELLKEKDRVEKLLLNIMPETVYEEWKEFGVITPQRFEEATVLMLDFVGFTQMSISHDPVKLIAELNDIFTAFDRIVEQFGCERLKTIGDAYMAVSGLPEPNPDHARNIASVALRFLHYLRRRNEASEFEWRARVGINTGPVIGSVVGVQKYVYDIFGPGVNLAARLESICEPMEIIVSEKTRDLICREFRTKDRGTHNVRGFGTTQLYTLEGSFKPANNN